MSESLRLVILASHPIQYQAPLFRHLAARPGVDLTVLFCSDAGLKSYHDVGFGASFRWDVPLVEGYRHEFLPNRGLAHRTGTFWGAINPKVRGRLQAGGFDALLVQGWALGTNWLAVGAARSLGLPLLLRAETNGMTEPRGARRFVKRNLLTRLFRRTAGFLAVGSLNHAFYRTYGVDEDRIFHAPYSVDNDFFRGHAEALLPRLATLRMEESIPADATVFLFCGKLSPVKRPLDALESFARLPDKDRCHMVYAGDGLLRGEILSRARELGLADRVRITGFLNQAELPRFYALADALVLPSGHEPWGLVVNEAMNFGLPIIVSDRVGAAPDLVREGENGFRFCAGDIPAMAQAMQRIASDRDLRVRLGEASRQQISGWGIAQTADGYLAALRAVASRRAGTRLRHAESHVDGRRGAHGEPGLEP